MAGLAKLVEDVKKYAGADVCPHRGRDGAAAPGLGQREDDQDQAEGRDDLGQEMRGRNCGPWADRLTAARANIRFASTAPPAHPATCAGRYAAASRHRRPPNAASAKDTTGLKWPPDTGPNIEMMANSPAAVAAAFSSNSSPVCPGDSRWAAIPEPTTTAARNPLPSNSASSRRHSAGESLGIRS